MAYRLKRRRSLARELSRVVAKEFAAAVDELTDVGAQGDAVHEARKSVKKVRAVLHLLQKHLGRTYRVQNKRLRTVAHQLAPLRDMDVMADTLKAVRAHDPESVTATVFASINRGLAARRRSTVARLDPERLLTRAAGVLRKSARTTQRHVREAANSANVEAGVARAYRRARKAMMCVQDTPEDVLFHAWRKRVKDHWYHMRLLEAVHDTARSRARELKQLETWLGDDHNLTLLRSTILNARSRFGRKRTTATVVGSIDTYQAVLRNRALELGERVFAHKPRIFRKSVSGWLQAQAAG
jgi:CHAD domain-containing protein